MRFSDIYYSLLSGGLAVDFLKWECTVTDAAGLVEAMEVRQRPDWDRARMVAYYAVSPYLKGAKKINDVIPMPWDAKKQRDARIMSREEFEELVKKRGLKLN